MPMRRCFVVSWVALFVALAGCGKGGAPSGSDPRTPAKIDAGSEGAQSAEPAPPPAPRAACSDAGCFACGEGLCPVGFYCEKTKAQTGCAWAAPCVDKPTCACLKPHVAGCSCEDRGGVAHVQCG